MIGLSKTKQTGKGNKLHSISNPFKLLLVADYSHDIANNSQILLQNM